MLFRIVRCSGRVDGFDERIRRASKEGALRGKLEAKHFTLSRGNGADRQAAIAWLNAAANEGRGELEAQRATEREIEAWDMGCRVAFLLEIV